MFKSLKRLFSGSEEPSQKNSKTSHNVNATQTAAQTAEQTPPSSGEPEDLNANNAKPAPPAIDLSSIQPEPDAIKLEALFSQAAHEANKREEFIKSLLEAELWVLGRSVPNEGGGTQVQLITQMLQDGSDHVALAFTSKIMMATAGVPADHPHLKIRTLDLMRMIHGQLGFALNPGGRVGKVFSKTEIAQILGGPSTKEVNMPEDMEVTIGQPSSYPSGLREALAAIVESSPRIRTIHTGLMSAGGEPPVLIAVVTPEEEMGRDEFASLVNDLSKAAGDKLAGAPINFAPRIPAFDELIEKNALIDVSALLA